MYDVTSRSSFESLDVFLAEARTFGAPASMAIVLCGNKADLEKDRRVSKEEGEKYAKSKGIPFFFETGSESGLNVKEAFSAITRRVLGV